MGIVPTPFWGHQNSAEFWQSGFVIDVKGCIRLLWTREFVMPSRFAKFGLLLRFILHAMLAIHHLLCRRLGNVDLKT